MKLVLGRYVLRIELCCLGNPEMCLFYGFECLIASPIPPKGVSPASQGTRKRGVGNEAMPSAKQI